MKFLFAGFAFAAIASAGTIGIGPWFEFGFDPDHAPIVAGCLPEDPAGVPCSAGIGSLNLDAAPWEFNAFTPVKLDVTDASLAGDSFSIFDFGVPIGSTSIVALGPFCGLDPNLCFASPAFSHASFVLPSGAHSLTIAVEAAQILGEGFLRIAPVPEPTYAGLFGIAIAACIGRWRLRKLRHV
jgi:hypothetical protein